MVKKTLEDKIKDLIFCTCSFLIIYLIFGYMLLSNWLAERVGLTKLYELIKDDLTITASLLAPVAALVVFNDWRETHARVNNEKISNEIIEILQEMLSLCSKGYNEYAKDHNLKKTDGEKISLLHKDLISYISRLNIVDQEAEAFKTLAYSMRNIFKDWWNCISTASIYYLEVHFNIQDQESHDYNFKVMNENGINALNKAILFRKNFKLIKPLLV